MSEPLVLLKLILTWIKAHSWQTATTSAFLLALWGLSKDVIKEFLKQTLNAFQPNPAAATAAKLQHLFTRFPRNAFGHALWPTLAN